MEGVHHAMTEAEIAAELGMSKAAVKTVLRRALAKIRSHPKLCARFRQAVEDKRRELDRRWMSRLLLERIQ